MTVLETKQIGEDVLRAQCVDVVVPCNDNITQMIEDLVDTMRDVGLVGLAAPQLGYNVNIFVAEVRKTKTRPHSEETDLFVCINPTIDSLSEQTNKGYEGCGSIARGELFGEVERPEEVTLSYYDKEGMKQTTVFQGLLSRVVQHEYDHLEGILFLDRMEDPTQLVDKNVYIKKTEERG